MSDAGRGPAGASQVPDGWLADLDRIFATTVDRVPNDTFTEPTALPGWTNAHVIAHVHFNALALCRLIGWARTGVESSMYASAAQRADEIEHGATKEPMYLRKLVKASAERFTAEFAGLTETQRRRIIVTAQGRHITAAELAWLRCRELGVHAVDLAAGTGFDDLPDGFADALVNEILAKRLAAGEGPVLASWLAGREPATPLGRWL